MTRSTKSTRRDVLHTTAGAIAIGLAGCLGSPTGAADQQTPADTETHGDGADDHDDGTEHGEEGHHDETEQHEEESEDHHEHSPTEHESGHGHEHDAPVSPPSDTATIEMTTTDAGQHFEPHISRVNVGGTVTWVNGSGSHTATAYHPDNDKPLLMPEEADPFDSGLLTDAQAEFSHTFESEGVYHFVCEPHESVGMLGSVIVGEPDAHGQPALEEIPDSLPETAQKKLKHINEKCNEALGHEH